MPVTINSGRTFLVSSDSGDIAGGEFGFYSSDTRLLSRYSLTANGLSPRVLTGAAINHFSSAHYMSTTPSEEKWEIEAGSVIISRKREIGEGLKERIRVESFDQEPCALELKLEFDSDFADIFEVKAGRLGTQEPVWVERTEPGITLYQKKGTLFRSLKIAFSKRPKVDGKAAAFWVELGRGHSWEVDLTFESVFKEEAAAPVSKSERRARATFEPLQAPRIETDYDNLKHAYDQSLRDINSLQLKGNEVSEGDVIPAAGIPWYLTAFGRDSLITAYQTMPFMPEFAKGVLRTLAKYQGRREDERTGEQPGRILHELRFGPLAEAGRVPTRFYSTVDATILYLIVLSEYYRWSGSTALIEELIGHAERALAWIDDYGDLDGDGFVEYTWGAESQLAVGGPIEYTWSSELGRYNQGWKDSWDSLSFSDGRLPDPPIALCEVQGYVFDAKMRISELYAALGQVDRSDELREEALEFQKNFERVFWMEEKGYYAAGLDGAKHQIDSLVSNQGHLLWSGIVSTAHARVVAERLFGEELFSGWGIRTMGSNEAAYNPASYHNGSVWPHDNSIIMSGLLRYGIIGPARRLISGFNSAMQHFPKRTPPELYCGFSQQEVAIPIAYPRSNAPQAWASGAVHLLLRTMLGLEPDAAMKQMSMYPWLIPGSDYLKVERLPVGESYISVAVRRVADGFDVDILENPARFRVITTRGSIGRGRLREVA